VSGFTKAYRRETPGSLVKTVDFEAAQKPAALAKALIAETLGDPDLVEVGYWQGGRFSIGLAEQPAADGNPGLSLGPETVFMVTGAAGGITSAIVADLAAASGGCFYLLDLAPLPREQDTKVQLFRQDQEALKTVLIESARAAGDRPTPARIENELQAIERQEAALRSVESVQAAGGQACYRSVNLLDGAAVAGVIEEVRQQHGRIDVLIHAAGMDISHSLADKDPAQFDLVYGVKADGIFNLLHAAAGLPIGALVCFSSVAGRFGNAGQTDYSAANDLLCKLVASLPAWRPETRGLAIDWTAWAGIGMATRGSIPKVMEYAGIETLPQVGIPRCEARAGCRRPQLRW
jgi:NAD(P)-dependent dehydrogenase (short-subunit alcohol dehydrogenase family)